MFLCLDKGVHFTGWQRKVRQRQRQNWERIIYSGPRKLDTKKAKSQVEFKAK